MNFDQIKLNPSPYGNKQHLILPPISNIQKPEKSWVQERILLVNLDGDDSSGKPHPFMNKQCQNIQWTSMLNNEPVL